MIDATDEERSRLSLIEIYHFATRWRPSRGKSTDDSSSLEASCGFKSGLGVRGRRVHAALSSPIEDQDLPSSSWRVPGIFTDVSKVSRLNSRDARLPRQIRSFSLFIAPDRLLQTTFNCQPVKTRLGDAARGRNVGESITRLHYRHITRAMDVGRERRPRARVINQTGGSLVSEERGGGGCCREFPFTPSCSRSGS